MTDFKALRNDFPITRNFVFLDVANKCAPPQRVADAVCAYVADQSSTGGDKDVWHARVEEVRGLFARLIGASPAEVALVKNTSEGFNLIANSLRYRAGDNIVITDLEHPNNTFPWLRLREMGVDVRIVPSHDGSIDPGDFEEYVDDRTRVVSVTSVACVTGARLDLRGISQVCHAHGAYLMVDAVQSLGILGLDVNADGIDFLASGGYKGLLALHGLGFLYCKAATLKSLRPPVCARANVKVDPTAHKVRSLDFEYREDAGKFEIGNYSYVAVTAGCESLDYILSVGVPAIEKRVLELSGLLIDGITDLGIRPLGPTDARRRSSIVSVVTPDAHAATRALKEHKVIASPREGAIRFAFHLYNNEEDIERALVALREVSGHRCGR
jgi:selenocysteine lyase/cysteine desulfurase